MRQWWGAQAPLAHLGRSIESFTHDEFGGSFRLRRDAIKVFLGLLGIPNVLRPASGRRFDGEEACFVASSAVRQKGTAIGPRPSVWKTSSSDLRNVQCGQPCSALNAVGN